MTKKLDVSFLYVFAAIEGGMPVAPCKIGITRNLVSRLSGVQTGSPKKLETISAIPIPDRALVEILEKEMHEVFDEFRLHGEWFDVCPVDAAIGICTIAHDAFRVLIEDDATVNTALQNLGITEEISRAFEYIEHCKAKGIPLKSRFMKPAGDDTPHTTH